MQYLILGAMALAVLFLILWIRRYYRELTFDKYLDIQVSVLLAKDRIGTRRAYGSLILELKRYDNHLRSIYITAVHSKNNKIRIKNFSGLLFEVNNQGREDTNMLSISVQMPSGAEDSCRENKEHVYVEGKLLFEDKKQRYFGKRAILGLIR